MTKKNLPYIPLYIGDWEKDCNVLSLQAEAAWLRIVLKMFSGGKLNSYKVTTKALQNLWRTNEEEVKAIISELVDNSICEVEYIDKFIVFTSRRNERENYISEIRKEAVGKRRDRTNALQNEKNALQTPYKTSTKDLQNNKDEKNVEQLKIVGNSNSEESDKCTNALQTPYKTDTNTLQNTENENEINKLISLEESTLISLDKSLSLKEEEEDKESLLLVPVKLKEENLVKEKGVKKKVAPKNYRQKRLVDVKEEDLAGEENGLYYARLALEIQQAIMLNMQEAGISTKIIENIKGKAIDEVRLMLTKQECTEQQLYEAIDFIREDRFWKTVILSIPKFREKLPNLLIKISENENVKGNNRFANERKHAEATRVASFIASGLNGAGIEKG